MHSKNNITTAIVIAVLVLTTIASVSYYISRPQSAASANEAAQQVASKQDNLVEASAPQAANQDKNADTRGPQPSGREALSQTKNDVTVEVTSAKIIDTGIEIGLCYTTLDGGEWYSFPGHLFYGAYEIYPDEAGLTSEAKANSNQLGKRCEFVRYRITDLTSITTPIQFSVTEFRAVPREMYSACQEFQQRLDTNPKARAYGLKAKCEESGDGSISITLVDYDKSVMKDKAKTTLDEIATGVVIGPWEFTITKIDR